MEILLSLCENRSNCVIEIEWEMAVRGAPTNGIFDVQFFDKYGVNCGHGFLH